MSMSSVQTIEHLHVSPEHETKSGQLQWAESAQAEGSDEEYNSAGASAQKVSG